MAAAIAGTLRMLLSLQFRPHIGPIFSDDSMAEVPRNQQGLRVILVLRSNAGGGAISAGGRDRRGGGAQPGGKSTGFNPARAPDFSVAELFKSRPFPFLLRLVFFAKPLSPAWRY